MNNTIVENKRKFLKGANKSLENILASMENLPVVDTKDLSNENTAVIVIDMVNGFVKEGALASERVKGLVPYLVEKLPLFEGYNKVFFADSHTEETLEFSSYPTHCLAGTKESLIIEELHPFVQDLGEVIPKNSTNGFVTKGFAEWMGKHPAIKNYIILGDCTDICVLQFTLSLKAYFNEWNVTSNMIVPIQGVETYEMEETNHNAELMNLFALYNMKINGIELVKDIVS